MKMDGVMVRRRWQSPQDGTEESHQIMPESRPPPFITLRFFLLLEI